MAEETNQNEQDEGSHKSGVDHANDLIDKAKDVRKAYRGIKNANKLLKTARAARAGVAGVQAAGAVAEGAIATAPIWGTAAVIILIALIIAVTFIIILGGGNKTTATTLASCDSLSTSNYKVTPASPVILTAVNCANNGNPFTYRWTTTDSAGTLSNPTGISTTYTPSSDKLTNITVTLVVCDQTNAQSCSIPYTIILNGTGSVVTNIKFYCQYASAWQSRSCNIASNGCTQAAVAMAMSSYRTDTFYNPSRVAFDNGGVDGCSSATSITNFNNKIVPYMQSKGYTVAPSVANGDSFNISQAQSYISKGYVIIAGGSVWFNSTLQAAPGGHAFLIVGANAANNTISVYDPTYCSWKSSDTLTLGVRSMVPQTLSCSYTAFDANGNATASNCLGKTSGGSQYVFNISNGAHGWYYARPVKL